MVLKKVWSFRPGEAKRYHSNLNQNILKVDKIKVSAGTNELWTKIKRPLNRSLRRVIKRPVVVVITSLVTKNKKTLKKLQTTANNKKHKKTIKRRGSGYRLVCQVRDKELIVVVIAVGKRDKNLVYKVAQKAFTQQSRGFLGLWGVGSSDCLGNVLEHRGSY